MSDVSNLMPFLLAGLGTVAAFYLLIPWLIFATQRMKGDPKIVLFDAEKNRPPKKVARFLDETGEALLGLGYEPNPCLALPDPMPNVRAIVQLWIHPERKDAALVSAIFGESANAAGNMQLFYTEFLSRFASEDISLIQTNNATTINAFAPLPDERTFRFPQVKSIVKLDRLHQKLVDLHGPSAKKIVSLHDQFRGDLKAYLRWALVHSYRQQEGTGYLRRDESADAWRPTVKGAYLMTWSQLFPMTTILKARMYGTARRMLRELQSSDD